MQYAKAFRSSSGKFAKRQYKIADMKIGEWYYDEGREWLVLRQRDGVIGCQMDCGSIEYYPFSNCSGGETYIRVRGVDINMFIKT